MLTSQPLKPAAQPSAKPENKPAGSERIITNFITSLNSEKPSEGTVLNFSWFRAGDKGLEILANEALATGLCSPGLTINLSGNGITFFGIDQLAKALESGKCPVKLNLILCNNKIFGDCIKRLASALRSGKAPSGLQIDLTGNRFIGTIDLKTLTEAVESMQSSSDIQIKFGDIIIGKPIVVEQPPIQSKL